MYTHKRLFVWCDKLIIVTPQSIPFMIFSCSYLRSSTERKVVKDEKKNLEQYINLHLNNCWCYYLLSSEKSRAIPFTRQAVGHTYNTNQLKIKHVLRGPQVCLHVHVDIFCMLHRHSCGSVLCAQSHTTVSTIQVFINPHLSITCCQFTAIIHIATYPRGSK